MTSAAAARAPREDEPLALSDRLGGLLERTAAGDALAARLLPTPSSTDTPPPPPEEFYWLKIPVWLAEAFGLAATAEGRELLEELKWIQYCVYAVFRVQDDLLDGETSETALAVQTNHLLVEASYRAARHFAGDSPFWSVFHQTIDATSRAIVELDRLQRSPDREPHSDLALYEDLSACLKIATAGVAIAAGRMNMWEKQISPALDGLAVATQIVDDIWDLREDLAEGRMNYAAWYLSRPVFGATVEATEAVVASNLMTTSRLEELLGVAESRIDDVARLAGTGLGAQARGALQAYHQGLFRLADQITRGRSGELQTGTAE